MLTQALKQCSVNGTQTQRIVTLLAPILTSVGQLSLQLKERIRVRNASRQRAKHEIRVIGLSKKQKTIAKKRESLKSCSVGVGRGNNPKPRGSDSGSAVDLSQPPAKRQRLRPADVIDAIPDINEDTSLTPKQKAWYEEHWPALETRYSLSLFSLSLSLSLTVSSFLSVRARVCALSLSCLSLSLTRSLPLSHSSYYSEILCVCSLSLLSLSLSLARSLSHAHLTTLKFGEQEETHSQIIVSFSLFSCVHRQTAHAYQR
jgi:hypothetical protein